MKAYADPTFEAVANLEILSCKDCIWRQWDMHSNRAWCDHDKWIGNDFKRPRTDGVNKLHRCTDYEKKVGGFK